MNPNQPQQPGQFNPEQYDFITNPAKPAKRSLLPVPGPGSSKKQRIIFIVIGGLVVLTLLILVFSLIFGGRGASTNQLVSIAQQQAELIRIADIGENKAASEEAKSLAVNVMLTMTTQQNNLVEYLEKNGKIVSSKELSAGKNTETDTALENAESNGRFDDVFLETINELLADYGTSLQDTFKVVSGSNAKQLLSDDYDQVKLLLSQD